MLTKSARLKNVKPSTTKAVTQKARQLKQQGRDILALSQGEPDFDTPSHILAFAKQAMDEGETRYTEVPGKTFVNVYPVLYMCANFALSLRSTEVELQFRLVSSIGRATAHKKRCEVCIYKRFSWHQLCATSFLVR